MKYYEKGLNSLMDKALFMITIGPVQSFIAEARKLKDLYAGSYLLSYIIKNMVVNIKEPDWNVEVVFPDRELESMPNRIVCILNYNHREEKEKFAESLSQKARMCFKDIAEKIKVKHGFQSEFFDEEINRFLEIHWCYRDLDSYETTYRKLVRDLQEVKRIRRFDYVEHPSGRTCSISGGRRALFALRDSRDLMKHRIILDMGTYRSQLSESLSAVSFVKRFLQDAGIENFNSSFPSVVNIALGNRLNRLLNGARLSAGNASGLYYYMNNGEFNPEEENDQDKDFIKELVKCIGEQKISVTSYYAVIKFDGDSMGKLYTAAALIDSEQTQEFHTYLSKSLMKYAGIVRQSMRPEEGVIVYTGGEDFLGFVCLDALFPVLKRLRNAFGEIKTGDFIKDHGLSFSAGITIAHIHEPLSDVMSEVNKAEHFAKDIDENKDAFAISLMVRGNQTVRARLKFGEKCENLELLNVIIFYLRKKKISHSFVYKLMEAIKYLEAEKVTGYILQKMIYLETIRLLSSSETDPLADENEYWKSFDDLQSKQRDADGYIQWLSICTFLEREAE